jgi:hypothetical protein
MLLNAHWGATQVFMFAAVPTVLTALTSFVLAREERRANRAA